MADEIMGYADIKERIADITAAVADDGLTLDEALDLYEEAVDLGSKASAAINDAITVSNEQAHADDADEAAADEAAADVVTDAAAVPEAPDTK